MMKGFKTVAFGLAVALLPAALDFLGGVPWQAMGIHPALAAGIGAAILGLRAFTTSPILRR